MILRDRRFPISVALSILLAGGASLLSAQTPPGQETSGASVASYSLEQSMPADPEALIGALPNGLRYYVRANAKPAHRAELRLVVKAGSVLEDDDQLGFAHFVEHMEFEGTRHFPRQGVVEFLGSLGLSIGADANAATSYDDTQYTLRFQPTCRACSIAPCWSSRIGRERPRSTKAPSTASAASSSRNGG